MNEGNRYLASDTDFDALYPSDIQMLSGLHFTPLHIAEPVTAFLTAGSGAKILDIGSGAGKYCLAGALYAPHARFCGVEQRASLNRHARKVQKILGVQNVSFITKNFTELNLSEFDHFYFFNSFYENIDGLDRIDEGVDFSEDLYKYYVRYLYDQLDLLPKGTRVATYHSVDEEIPAGYKLINTLAGGDLKFWVKQ